MHILWIIFVLYPVIEAAPRNTTTLILDEGISFNLECDISPEFGKEVDFVSWFKDRTFLNKMYFTEDGPTPGREENEYRIFPLLSDLKSVLRLKEVTKEHEGEYKCRVRFKNDNRRKEFSVLVKVKKTACLQPEAPEHGAVRLTGEPKIGSLAFYSCFEGRKLVGSATSKCLESGLWTFETPKCYSHCTVPVVSNGDIGQYEEIVKRFRTTREFVAYDVGDKIDSGEKVTLLCSNGYFPEGNSDNKSPIEVACKDGEWEQPMECKTGIFADDLNPAVVEENSTSPTDDSNKENATKEPLNQAVVEKKLTDLGNSEKDNDPPELITELPDPGASEETLNSSSTERNFTNVIDASNFDKEEEPDEPVPELPDEDENFCGRPPVLNGSTTQLKGNKHAVETVATYRCEFGFIPQGSGKLQAICQLDEQTDRVKWKKPKVACVPRSCGDPGYVRFGHRVGNLFTFPNKVEFNCDEGYKLKGTGVRYCQVTGEWSGRLPTCEQIYCPVPPHPENGRVKYSSLEYGALLQYECEKGFVLRNHQPRYCSEGGTWSEDQPSCNEAACLQPEAPEHGTVRIVGEPKVGSLALYDCHGGRKLVGSPTSRCLESGMWTFETPKCYSHCIVPVVSNGGIGRYEEIVGRYRTTRRYVAYDVGDKIDSGEKVTLRCSNGYFPEGSSDNKSPIEVACKDGEWEQPMECKTAACLGEPPAIENGYPVVSRNHHGYVIYYKCTDDVHYKKVAGHVQCQYGSWVGNPPSCTDTRCYLRNLYVLGVKKPDRQYILNDRKFRVSCMEGYRLSSDDLQISCVEGLWNIPRDPCTEEERTQYGVPTTSPTRSHTQLVRTTEIYTPALALFTTSKPTDAPAPSGAREEDCSCIYSTYNNGINAYVNGVKLAYGSRIKRGDSATVNCSGHNFALIWKNGLRVSGAASLSCDVCEKWIPNETFPSCAHVSRYDPSLVLDKQAKVLTNGKIQFPANQRVMIMCESKDNYPEWNADSSTHAVFSYIAKVETDVMFKKLAEFARIEDSDVHSYECYTRTRYNPKMASTFLHIQISDGTLRCPDIYQGDVLAIYSNDRKVDSEARLFCRDNRKAVAGLAVRKCMANGKWSGSDDMTCEEIKCPEFPLTDGLDIYYSYGNNVGSTATFRCSNSGDLLGATTAQCLGNGTWSNRLPSCQRVVCPKLPEIEDLEISYTNEQYSGSMATFHCKPPSVLSGAAFKTCTVNGQWSNNVQTSCLFRECPIDDLMTAIPENIIPNMEHITSETVPDNTELQLLCENNLVLTGDPTVQCLKGSWKLGSSKCESLCLIGANVSPQLIVSPKKDSYGLGDFISLSCSNGYVLTSEVEKTMCMLGSWTDELPGCVPNSESEK